MLRSPKVYDELDKTIIDIYVDYGFNCFPLNEEHVCNKLGLRLMPYSAFSDEEMSILKKKSFFGFYPPESANHHPTIFYNDTADIKSEGCKRQTIFHEIKHYVYDEYVDNPDEDDLAEHFGRYFMCPTPYLIIKDIVNPQDIVDIFNVSYSVATNVSKSVSNRKRNYGERIFDYEKPLIKLLDPDYYYSHISKEVIAFDN